jgi:hypothetical protein
MKRLKIFKFKKGQVVDLTTSPEYGCNAIECGRDRFTLRDFKLQDGHDDSIPYSAILCVNDKPICKCFNDGWGGQTEMTPLDVRSKAMMAGVTLNLSKYQWGFHGTTFNVRIDFIADTLACGLEHIMKVGGIEE